MAQRCQGQFPIKAYLWNAAALSLGYKGMDRQLAPKPTPSATAAASSSSSSAAAPVAAAEEQPKLPLKAHVQMTFDENCCNQFDRAAWLYGSVDNMHLQRIMTRCLSPTSQRHSKCHGPLHNVAEMSFKRVAHEGLR